MKLTSILIILLFAFTLAACGGGGSSGPAAPETPTTPETPMMHDVELGDLTLPANEDGYEVPAGGTLDVGEGESQVTLSCPGETACMVTVDEDGMATSTGGEVTAALSAAAMQAIADREAMEAMEAMEAQAAMDETEAMLIVDAIKPTGRNVADLGGSLGTAISGVQVPFNADGKMLATTYPDTSGDMDDDFAKSDTAPAGISGLTGAMYERTTPDNAATANVNEQVIDSVVTYTDQAEKTDAAYVGYMGDGVDLNHDGSDTSPDGVNLNADTGVLTLTPGSLDFKRVSADFGLTAASQTNLAIPPDEKDGDESTIEGMFHGVSGTFTCTGECTVSSDDKGQLSGLGGTTWTFKPDALDGLRGAALTKALGDLKVPGVVEDPDYMTFGYWLSKSKTDKGADMYAMSPFAEGKRDYGTVESVLGKAIYEGSATGLYMKKSLTSDGSPTRPFSSGQFTADAMLEANFAGGEIGDNHQFSVTGTISNFMDGSEMINEHWVVNLNRRMINHDSDANTPNVMQKNIGPISTTLHRDGTAGTFDGMTDGGTLGSGMGHWSGEFHGVNDPDTTAAEQPSYATGIFDGHFTNGHVRGAFGVTKE